MSKEYNKNKKIKIEDAYKRVLDRCIKINFTLTEDFEYIGTGKTKIHLICNKCGCELFVSYNDFVNSKCECRNCGEKIILRKYKKTQDANKIVIERCIKMNYTLVEKFEYIGNRKTTLILLCNKCGHSWNPTYSDFINGERSCPKCAGHIKLMQEETYKKVLDRCEKMDYILVNEFRYENQKTKIQLMCKKHNCYFSPTYDNFIRSETGCPECASQNYKSQNKIGEMLDELNIKYISQYRNFVWLKSQSLDYFLPKYNIGIEYQGSQHFKPTRYRNSDELFKKQIERDIRKKRLCEEHDLKLIYLTFEKKVVPQDYHSIVYIGKEKILEKLKSIIN